VERSAYLAPAPDFAQAPHASCVQPTRRVQQRGWRSDSLCDFRPTATVRTSTSVFFRGMSIVLLTLSLASVSRAPGWRATPKRSQALAAQDYSIRLTDRNPYFCITYRLPATFAQGAGSCLKDEVPVASWHPFAGMPASSKVPLPRP